MAGRMLEMAIAIKGKLEKTYTDSMRRAIESAENVQKKMGKISQAMAGAQKSASLLGRAESELAAKFMQLRSVEKAAEDFRKLKTASQTTSQEFMAAQAKVAALAQAMRTAAAPTKQMQQQFEQARAKAGALKAQLASQQGELQRLRSSLSAAGFSTKEFADSEARLREEIARTSAAIEKQNASNAKLSAARERKSNASQEMFHAYGNFQGAVGTAQSIMSPFVGAVEGAMEFEHAMSRVKALTQSGLIREGAFDEVAVNMQKLEAKAKELGATTQYTMTQAADAMGYLGMAGWKTEQIYETMPGMLKLAAGAGTDLARTADIVSDNMTAMGVPTDRASHFMDVYAYALTNANVNLESLGETMKYAAPVAAAFGASLEDTAAMTMMMGNAGIKGSMAGTALRMGLLRLSGPPKKASKEMEALGISVSDATAMALESEAALKALGVTVDNDAPPMEKMGNIIRQLQEKMQGLSREEKLSAVSAIFGANAASGWINIIEQGADTFDKYRDALQHADGYAEQFEKTMNDDARGAMISLGSAIDAVEKSVGGAFLNGVRSAAEGIAPLMTQLAAWISANEGIVKWIGLIAAAVSGLIVAVSGVALAFAGWQFVTAQIALMKTEFLALKAVTWLSAQATAAHTAFTAAFGAATTALRNPLGTVTALLGAMPAKLRAVQVAAMGMPGKMTGAFKALPGIISGAFAALPGIMASMATVGLPVILAIGAIIAVIAILAANWESIKNTAEVVWNHISGTISAQVERIKAAFAGALDKITEVWNSVTGQTMGSSQMLMAIINNIGFAIGAAFDIAAGLVTTSIGVILNLVVSLAQVIGGVVNIVLGLLTGDWERAWSGAGQVVDGFLGGTLGTIKEVAGGIGSIFDTLMGKADEVENKAKAAQSSIANSQPAGTGSIPAESIANAQQVAAATQQAATASGQASANTMELSANMQQAGASAQQTSGYMQQLQQVMQQVPAASQGAFANMGTEAATAAQAVNTNMAQIPTGVQQTLAGLPPIAQTNTDAMVTEFSQLATKCQPGGEAFVQAANNWGQQAYENIANWSEQMANVVTERLTAAWNQISAQFSAGLNVHVTTSGGADVAHNATGGIYGKGAFLTTFAEDGPEAAIPLDGTQRAISLWEKAGEILGVLPEAQAPAVGTVSSTIAPVADMPAPLADINAAVSSADIAHNATGGIYKRGAFLTTFAEKSPEAAIPLDGSDNAVSLWQKAGELLGVLPKAGAEQGDRQSKAASIIQQLPFKLPALPDISSISQEGVIPSLLNSFPSIPSVFPGMGDNEKKSVLETSREATDYSLPVQRESGSSGNTVIEINMPAITINGNADAGTVNQLEGLMAKLEADLMRKMEQRFPGMVERNRQQERRLSYAT